MPLTEAQEDLEHLWKVRAMKADVELKHTQNQWEPWKVLVSAVAATATFAGGVAGVLGYLIGAAHH